VDHFKVSNLPRKNGGCRGEDHEDHGEKTFGLQTITQGTRKEAAGSKPKESQLTGKKAAY